MIFARLSALISQGDGKIWGEPLLLDKRENDFYSDRVLSYDGILYIK